MKHILKSIFSICLMLLSLAGSAQEKQSTAKKDSVQPKKERYGLRLGADLYKLTRSAFDKNYRGIELVGDYRLTRKHYLAAEIGNEDKTTKEDYINFTTKGNYIKVGFDYNAYENWRGMENMIYFGLRYGFSTFSQNVNNYQIYNTNHYFNENPIYPGQDYTGLTAHWLEVVAGVKVEVFQNLYAGFSFRLNRLIAQTKPDNFENLYIPGFNRTYAGGGYGAGFNYTISYLIPFYKETVKPKEKKK